MSESKPIYDESTIVHLTPMEHVRLRPGMYFVGTDIYDLHDVVYYIFDVIVSDALSERGNHISITLREDNEVALRDNGIGFPVKKHENEDLSIFERVMTQISAGDRWG